MYIFSEENTVTVLIIDAENAFISINRKVMLHNIKFLCLLKFMSRGVLRI